MADGLFGLTDLKASREMRRRLIHEGARSKHSMERPDAPLSWIAKIRTNAFGILPEKLVVLLVADLHLR